MKRYIHTVVVLVAATSLAATTSTARAQQRTSLAKVSEEVNKRMVKLFGAGGFRGLVAYGTGIVVSPEGHILTVANHLLDTQDLRVHLYDGRRYRAKVLVMEPALSAALLKITADDLDLPYFDVEKAAQAPLAKPGDWVLAFSNQFEIATRDEPMTVQHGVIAAYSKLYGRRGVFQPPYQGDVYIVDAITNNPGAAGGALTTRDGRLLGIIGKELRNTLTDTWINYAVPIQVVGKPYANNKESFISLAKKGEWRQIETVKRTGEGGFHGVVLVPDVLERTPPYVEDVLPESPAAKAGLQPDDLIVYINGDQIVSVKAFNEYMNSVPPGTEVVLEVRRSAKAGGSDKLVSIKLKVEKPKPASVKK
ncbi:MAG: serine protease [Gemmatales bacterium]|nr:MAG: serine protease [Gemmatales bacterium]